MRARAVTTALLGLWLVTLATGCGYRLAGTGGSVLPEHIKIIAVLPFENGTTRPEIEQRATEAVVDTMTRRGNYQVETAADRADALLDGWVTRYSDAPLDPDGQQYGSVVKLTADGALLQEIRFEREEDRFRAPKSVAVDPTTGEIWVNADVFYKDGSVQYEAIRLGADGSILEYRPSPPELHFVTFDDEGRGYFAESEKGQLVLRITRRNRRDIRIPLGRRTAVNFVQDIQFGTDGTAALSLWSGRVVLVRLEGGDRFQARHIWLRKPTECSPPNGNSLLYTAVPYKDAVYATLFCGPTVMAGINPLGP